MEKIVECLQNVSTIARYFTLSLASYLKVFLAERKRNIGIANWNWKNVELALLFAGVVV